MNNVENNIDYLKVDGIKIANDHHDFLKAQENNNNNDKSNELADECTNILSNQAENFKASHKKSSKTKVLKKAVAISLAAILGVAAFAKIEDVRSENVYKNVNEAVSEDEWSYLEYHSGENKTYENLANFYNSLMEKGYSADEIAIASDRRIGVGIKNYAVPGTTLIGRINAKNQAFLESINLNENNQTEGISR